MSRPLFALIVLLAVIAAACGGGSQEALPEPTATPRPIPTTSVATDPDSTIPFADVNVRIATTDRLTVRAGETVSIDVLVYNARPERSSIRLRSVGVDGPTPELAVTSIGMDGYGIFETTVEVRIPDGAEPGDTYSFGTQAIRSSDADHRLTATTELTVVDTDAARPAAAPNRAETRTNEKVLAYVVGNDIGRGLDVTSLRIVGGAFRAADTETTTTGFLGYTPYENLTGPDALLYELCTTDGLCDTAILTVDVLEA